MKVFAFIVAIVFVAKSSSATIVAPVTLQELKQQFQDKFATKGIIPPQDDPLQLNDTTVNINSTRLNAELSISDSVVTGLSGMLDHLQFNLATLDIDIEFILPEVAISGRYNIDGTIDSPDFGLLNVTGHGEYSASAKNGVASAGGRLQIIIVNNRVRVVNVRLNATFEEAEVYAENAELNGHPIDWEAVNVDIKRIFDETFAKYYEDVKTLITDSVNEILGQYTLAEIIAIIIGAGGGKEDYSKLDTNQYWQ